MGNAQAGDAAAADSGREQRPVMKHLASLTKGSTADATALEEIRPFANFYMALLFSNFDEERKGWISDTDAGDIIEEIIRGWIHFKQAELAADGDPKGLMAVLPKPEDVNLSSTEVGFMMQMVPEILMEVKEDGKKRVTQRALVWTIMYGLEFKPATPPPPAPPSLPWMFVQGCVRNITAVVESLDFVFAQSDQDGNNVIDADELFALLQKCKELQASHLSTVHENVQSAISSKDKETSIDGEEDQPDLDTKIKKYRKKLKRALKEGDEERAEKMRVRLKKLEHQAEVRDSVNKRKEEERKAHKEAEAQRLQHKWELQAAKCKLKGLPPPPKPNAQP